MIRSSKFIFQYQTQSKTDEIIKIYQEYVRLVNEYIFLFYTNPNQEFNTETVHSVDSLLSSRYKSNACKQALETIKSIINKRSNRNKFISKPSFNGEMILDAKFVSISLDKPNSFDLWLRLSTSNKGHLINIPCKRHKQFNKWLELGTLKQAIAIKYLNSKLRFRLFVDIPDKPVKTEGQTVGLDIGKNKLAFLSDRQVVGLEIKKRINKIRNCKFKSKGYYRALENRNNYINQQLNLINFSNINHLVVEDIKELKRNRKDWAQVHYWNYPFVFDKLGRLCQENCVLRTKINPAYTSQKCSVCGYVDKVNRSGENFHCLKCGNVEDADYNASVNIRESGSLESPDLLGL